MLSRKVEVLDEELAAAILISRAKWIGTDDDPDGVYTLSMGPDVGENPYARIDSKLVERISPPVVQL